MSILSVRGHDQKMIMLGRLVGKVTDGEGKFVVRRRRRNNETMTRTPMKCMKCRESQLRIMLQMPSPKETWSSQRIVTEGYYNFPMQVWRVRVVVVIRALELKTHIK